ncbi:MAG: hypothetical protein AMJ42_04785 [Deltaproteobacteria bacterium DG_8]|nr:MAG: hypothetical protein AMJ42_04785 [Deltaproteobacteria bacterium DG_8]
MILVSACLVGINCRYDGSNLLNNDLLKKIKAEDYVPVCPEQLGGLPTPRPRSSIQNGTGVEVIAGKAKVMDFNGNDVTKEFLEGAHESLKIAKFVGVKKAILKENSPSCGVDFTHSNFKKVKGTGIFTAMLKNEGIKIFSEYTFEEI